MKIIWKYRYMIRGLKKMRCAKSYQDIESPDDYKDNSDYFEEFIERYIEKWGEQSDEDFDIIHLYWYTIVTDYLDETILDISVNEMRESLVWYFKRSSEQRLKDIWVLQEQIRKMKCCGNCRFSESDKLNGTFCHREGCFVVASANCKLWEN